MQSSTFATWFLFVIVVFGALRPATASTDSSVSAADEVRVEASRGMQPDGGYPLPLVAHWTTGIHPRAEGWSPKHQLDLIDAGHHLLPWFDLPRGPLPSWLTPFRAYYEDSMKKAAALRLPLTFVGSQWESGLSQLPYFGLPSDLNPNVITAQGDVLKKVSPFGPVEPWRELGRSITATQEFALLQDWYAEPPLVVFLSNNEHSKLRWQDVEEDARYLETYGHGHDDDFKRAKVAEGWIVRYRALQQGMREGLASRAWQNAAIFVGYEAVGPRHMGRWGGWSNYSLMTEERIDPSALTWDGGSSSYYLNSWEPVTDYWVRSPQVEFMNLVSMNEAARKENPLFWYEMSVWDGHAPDNLDVDKRSYFASLGQSYSPERYAGAVQFGMWLTRPRVVREFRGWMYPFELGEAYFMSLVEAVDRVHANSVLRAWWKLGQLVENPIGAHPYQTAIPEQYNGQPRWFLLDTSLTPPRPWQLDTEIKVFALALKQTIGGHEQWLIYAHSPLADRTDVAISVPGYGEVVVDVPVGGTFYLVDDVSPNVVDVLGLKTGRNLTPLPPVIE